MPRLGKRPFKCPVAEAGVELSAKTSGNTQFGGRVVQNPVQTFSDVADIAASVARLTSERRAALLAMIDAAKTAGSKGVNR